MKKTILLFVTGTLALTTASVVRAQFPTTPGGGGQRPAATIPGVSNSDVPRGNAKLTGIIVDSTTSKPVEFASVALIDVTTKRPIDGTVADEKGRFTLNKLPSGDFQLLISFVGYRNKTISSVKLDRRGDVNLGTVMLAPDIRTLSEVNVVGQAAIVEEKVDRLVYNAEKDVTSKGGDATDVMRKVPLLSVDLDGNVSLRGSSNVRVLINNKPSTIVASSVADALKQIPADMIKTVEVITSPSAKYDAEGSAGIINIITKKTTLQGFTLNLDSGVGNRGTNLGLNGNLRTGKMGFSLSGFGRANYNVRGRFANTQQTFNNNGTTITTEQSADTRSQGVFGQYTLGWDYDISKTSAITASLRYGARNNTQFQDNFLTRSMGAYLPTYNLRNVQTKDLSGTVDANIDYTKTYAKPQQEFSVSAQFSRNNRNNDFTANLLSQADFATITSRQQNLNDSYNQETTLRADYQTPIGKNQLIEFGGKGIFRQVESSFRYNFASGAMGMFVLDQNRPANTLNYDQNIAAGYGSYTLTTKSKFTLKAGLRYEYTTINANYSRTQPGEQGGQAGEDLGIPSYSNLVPSINLSKTLKGGKTIKLAYNRRLQRPGIQFLNPNVNAANPTNITQGNPLLSPELTDNLEFSTSAYVKNVYLNATLFARLTNNSITSVRDTVTTSLGEVTNPTLPRPIRTTYLNIGREEAYGINIFGNATLFSKWQIGGGFDAFYAYLTNNSATAVYRATNSGWVVTGRFFTSLNIKNGWGLQGFGFIRGRQIQLQGSQGGFAFYSLGIKKDLKDKRGSFGIAGENFFNNPFTIRAESSSPIFAQNSVTSLYNAGIRVNFSYKFGKMSFDQPQRQRNRGANDDLKDEGGNDNAGAQQPAQPAGGTPASGGGGRRPR
ncbi:TonB-dependent receptor [Spirosoma taeanense]|uniref:TonB-dependent receptor n=1 Tax=Spirosoma taeanense TaxID=2735870 RepID=A0A6M5Y927_9BACT|nr:TonB-dependent receptor [Spirosoma taeanense]QJW90439.1 TonB-dependent receptor [Spirosoma taeanense]